MYIYISRTPAQLLGPALHVNIYSEFICRHTHNCGFLLYMNFQSSYLLIPPSPFFSFFFKNYFLISTDWVSCFFNRTSRMFQLVYISLFFLKKSWLSRSTNQLDYISRDVMENSEKLAGGRLLFTKHSTAVGVSTKNRSISIIFQRYNSISIINRSTTLFTKTASHEFFWTIFIVIVLCSK